MIVLSHDQLTDIAATLPDLYPKSLQLDAMVRNRLNGRYDWPGTEFVVDNYPDYSLLMCRPIKNSPDYVPWPRAYCVTIFCRNPDRLEEILRQDDFVDWSQRVAFFGITKEHVYPAIVKRCEELGSFEPAGSTDDNGILHLLHPSHLTKTDLPEGFRLGELKEEHAEQVNAEWHYGKADSLNFFKHLLRHGFPSSAVFAPDGRLVAYLLYALDGSMFNGFVDPEFRNKGLYQVVNYDLACKVVAMGAPLAWVYVMPWNTASLKAYAKLGAKKVPREVYSVMWYTFMPPKK